MSKKARFNSKTRRELAPRSLLRLGLPAMWKKTPLLNPHSRRQSCTGSQGSPILGVTEAMEETAVTAVTEEMARATGWGMGISPTVSRTLLLPYPKEADINEREQEIKRART